MLRIALIQQVCEKAAIRQNLDALSAALSDAAALDIDIAAFPEMNITGYADPTRYPGAIIHLDGPEIDEFLQHTAAFAGTVLAGFIEENPGQKPFITQVAARQGRLLGVYRKMTIKDEECDWFSPGENVPVFQHDDLTFGIAICADIDNPQVFADCRRQGAQIIFELAAPGLYGEQATRNWQSSFTWWQGGCLDKLGAYARQQACWIATATQAGRTIDEDFPGGGFLFDPSGRRVFTTPDGSPGQVYFEIDLAAGSFRQIGLEG